MESLYQLLQGSYGYLLIFQILVVTGLFVFFLWMMAQRTKNAYYAMSPSVDGTAPGPAVSSGITPSEYQQLKEKCAHLEAENAKANALKEEYEGLLQKVKFLESKLLEYEILQEEIGTLSSLKVENEKLKGELQVLQREIAGSKRNAESSPPSMPEIPAAAPEPTAPTMPDLSGVPNLDFSTTTPTPPAVGLGADAALNLTAPEIMPETPPPPSQDDGLEGLLKQIDNLTQNQK